MKAIRVAQFGDPNVLQLADLPTPQPADGQILIRVHAIGVNPVETYIRSGAYPAKPTLPYTPGSDCAGIVEAVGTHVAQFKPGDRVYTAGTLTGSYAEFTLCQNAQVHPLPANLTFAQGAAIGVPYATAYRALMDRAEAVPGEMVLIHGGSGGVGLAAVQIARAQGLHIFATAGTEKGRELVLKQGAHKVFDHRTADYTTQLMTETGGRGVDVILEMLANRNLAKDLTLLAARGRVIIIGSRGPVEINPRDAMARDAEIRGMILANTPPAELARIHAALFLGFENGAFNPVIARELPLAAAPAAHQAVMEPGASGKIILLPNP